jgi:hypothetical protein
MEMRNHPGRSFSVQCDKRMLLGASCPVGALAGWGFIPNS